MKKYQVPVDDFYKMLPPIDSCEAPISELVKRYSIKGKTITSVGAGAAHEEYWFIKANNKLTVFDIDEHGTIEPELKQLDSKSDNSKKTFFTYYVGDFTKYQGKTTAAPASDILYLSSFTPDELRRADIQKRYMEGKLYSWIRSCYLNTTKRGYLTPAKAERYFPLYSWPAFKKPFHPIISQAVDSLLKPGGLFILQSYCGGIDANFNKNFIPAVKKQLKSMGLTLLETYNFVESPAVLLMTAIKAPETDINMDNSCELTSFHGRSPLSLKGIQKIYPSPTQPLN